MQTVLIVAPDEVPQDEGEMTRRAADLFDIGLVEIVRTLAMARRNFKLLVPWTRDLAALISAATLDAAPAFDPEGSEGKDVPRSIVVPYAAGDSAKYFVESVFWRSSHLSLNLGAPTDIRSYLDESRLDHVIALGLPNSGSGIADTVRLAIKQHSPSIYVFGQLSTSVDTALALRTDPHRVIDLSAKYGESLSLPSKEARETESMLEWESDLEPYVPFGLLIQRAILDMFDSHESEASPA